jgi:hypothetical protein
MNDDYNIYYYLDFIFLINVIKKYKWISIPLPCIHIYQPKLIRAYLR